MNGLLYQGDKLAGEDLSVKIWKGGQFMFLSTTMKLLICSIESMVQIWKES
jgi:hypothetical protein